MMHVVKAILDFLGIFAASFLVGSIMGCITALLTKFTHIRAHPMLESTLLVLMSYSTFLLEEVRQSKQQQKGPDNGRVAVNYLNYFLGV